MVDEPLDDKKQDARQHESRDDGSPKGVERIFHEIPPEAFVDNLLTGTPYGSLAVSGESITTMSDHANHDLTRIMADRISCQFAGEGGRVITFGESSLPHPCRSGETGRRKGLKIPRPKGHTGSIPVSGTKHIAKE